ncbi:MAG TPA: hypothetical protein VKZ18_09560 [Polyangia bacterium]|nr:hypothetical protein [Polyangia bacterium]
MPNVVEHDQVTGARFTVERVDQINHSVVVRAPDGQKTTIRFAPTTEGWGTLAKGQPIALDYYRASLLSLNPADTAATEIEQAPSRANAPVLGAAGGQQITTAARVTDVDADGGTLAVTTPDGLPHTLPVEAPAARERLRSLRPGDQVVVTYTEAVAVGVHAGDEQSP